MVMQYYQNKYFANIYLMCSKYVPLFTTNAYIFCTNLSPFPLKWNCQWWKNVNFLTQMQTKCVLKYQKSKHCVPNVNFADLFGSTAIAQLNPSSFTIQWLSQQIFVLHYLTSRLLSNSRLSLHSESQVKLHWQLNW